MSIDDTVNIFKDNDIQMEPISMKNYFDIEESYRELNKLNKLNDPDNLTNDQTDQTDHSNNLNNHIKSKSNFARTTKLRQHIEYLKIPTFVEQTLLYISQGNSVVIFVNFTKTLIDLAAKLNTNCLIHGQQTIEERSINIEDFCTDKSRIIICNIRSGGTGISLHDTLGVYPRISLISPTWSAQDLLQVLGRIHRAMAKTNCIQKIIFCKGTFDEHIGSILKTKINNIQILNNGEISQSKLDMSVQQQNQPNQPNQPNYPTKTKSKIPKSSQTVITNLIKNSYVI
jgi:superfamily II DNA or RNA helicase